MDETYLLGGKIVNIHGIKGEVKAICYTDSPEFLQKAKTLWFSPAESFPLVSCRAHKGAVILKLAGLDDPDAAMAYRGRDFYVERQPLPKGRYYVSDILGMTVEDAELGHLGTVTDVFSTGSNDVYEIKRPAGPPLYIPVLKSVVQTVDLTEKKIFVRLPEGILD